MNLRHVIAEECCTRLKESSKTEVLIEMMEGLHAAGYVDDLDALKKEIFYREQLMSTGIGMGIGIPHVRFRGLEKPVVAVGVRPRGVADYESIDSEEVKIVLMILVGEEQHKEHIRLLSQMMERLKEADQRERLIAAEAGGAMFALLTEEVSHG